MAANGSGRHTTDHETNDSQSRGSGSGPSRLRTNSFSSIGRTSSAGGSMRRLFSLQDGIYTQLDDDTENEIVSQAGDIGDRELSRRGSQRPSLRFTEQGVVLPMPENFLKSYDFWSHDLSKLNTTPPVLPLASEVEEEKVLPPSLEYIGCLVYLAVFGILGVLTRYLLQKLFGPGVVGLTSDHTILYLDLPSNMVGSFLMGWFGVVFKGNISRVSDQLAIGISTGFLGSLTTFSGWNQKMLDLSIQGHWVFAVLGFAVGLFLCAYSIIFGVETAKGFRWLLRMIGLSSCKWRVNRYKHHLVALLVFILIWGGLWATSVVLEKKKFENGGSGAQLWLACLVGPFGVWIRWWLARLNGPGLGKAGRWTWIPFGTLIANVSAACIMAALATTKKAIKTKNCDTVATGIQFGLMGCLSTVSTFMAEFNAMRQSSHPWRAYTYAIMTIGISFGFGTLIYSAPVWAEGYS